MFMIISYLKFLGFIFCDDSREIDPNLSTGNIIKIVNDTLETLTPREDRVMCALWGLKNMEGRERSEIAKIEKITEERTLQIMCKAYAKLRHPSRELREKIFSKI